MGTGNTRYLLGGDTGVLSTIAYNPSLFLLVYRSESCAFLTGITSNLFKTDQGFALSPLPA